MPTLLPAAAERAILRICEDISTPRSLAISMMVKSGEWDQLSTQKVNPRQYTSAHAYWLDASVSAMLRKMDDLPTTFDRKAVAVENFYLGERDCFRTNQRLYPYVENIKFLPESEISSLGGLYLFIGKARKIIADILGPCPDVLDGRFGPGATYGDKGKLTTVPDKMSSRPTLTSDCLPWLFQWSGTQWASACAVRGRDPTFIRGNRFTTVPKDCTKDRGIAVEPSINLFYQLAYGRLLKKRLKSAGVDLQDGQDIHRRVACEASKEGHLATLDLKNASDSIARRFVELLLPSRWFEALTSLRSPTTLIQGKTILLEKFSSMGNGFTFELETLLFLGLCLAIDPAHKAGENVFVYGDDIIVPTNSSKGVIECLSFFGMTVNWEKSFIDGKFRESCGGDYFEGVDVRPFFLKSSPNEPQQLISFANGLRRMWDSHPHNSERFACLRRGWHSIIDGIPTRIRGCRGPRALGDLVIHDNEERWKYRWRNSIRYVQCYRPARFLRIAWDNWHPDVILAAALYGSGDERGGSHPLLGVTPRSAVLGYKVGWVASS